MTETRMADMVRRLVHEFEPGHYHTCPADHKDADPKSCDCFGGHLISEAQKLLATPSPTSSRIAELEAALRDVRLVLAGLEKDALGRTWRRNGQDRSSSYVSERDLLIEKIDAALSSGSEKGE